MNIKKINNHKNTMDMMMESVNDGYRKHFAERSKTVEEKVKESGIDYQIDGDHILIGKPLEDYDRCKEMETERAIEEEDEQERYAADRENEYFKYAGC